MKRKASWKIRDKKVVQFIAKLAKSRRGIITPEEIVEEARPSRSPIHKYFEWDDNEAAQQWRIHQARNLLRVVVRIIDVGGTQMETRVLVSLTPDRNEDGGYRVMTDVLNDVDMRTQMLADALEELKAFRLKYGGLQELARLFAEADKLGAK